MLDRKALLCFFIIFERARSSFLEHTKGDLSKNKGSFFFALKPTSLKSLRISTTY